MLVGSVDEVVSASWGVGGADTRLVSSASVATFSCAGAGTTIAVKQVVVVALFSSYANTVTAFGHAYVSTGHEAWEGTSCAEEGTRALAALRRAVLTAPL